MLFAHGFGCDQNMWRYVASAFENEYRIVLFDLGVSCSRTAEGSGLGLAISRDLARGMGGDLSAASKLDRGSTFSPSLDTPTSGEPTPLS